MTGSRAAHSPAASSSRLLERTQGSWWHSIAVGKAGMRWGSPVVVAAAMASVRRRGSGGDPMASAGTGVCVKEIKGEREIWTEGERRRARRG